MKVKSLLTKVICNFIVLPSHATWQVQALLLSHWLRAGLDTEGKRELRLLTRQLSVLPVTRHWWAGEAASAAINVFLRPRHSAGGGSVVSVAARSLLTQAALRAVGRTSVMQLIRLVQMEGGEAKPVNGFMHRPDMTMVRVTSRFTSRDHASECLAHSPGVSGLDLPPRCLIGVRSTWPRARAPSPTS